MAKIAILRSTLRRQPVLTARNFADVTPHDRGGRPTYFLRNFAHSTHIIMQHILTRYAKKSNNCQDDKTFENRNFFPLISQCLIRN